MSEKDPRVEEISFRPTPEEAAALRAFLARGETRLTTMHRTAVGFLNGAGLLALFPALVGQAVASILLYYLIALFSKWEYSLSVVPLFIPWAIVLYIPGLALYNLFKDIVQVLFSGQAIGDAKSINISRFALSGIAFSSDESPRVKDRIVSSQIGSDFMYYILHRSSDEQAKQFVGLNLEDLVLPNRTKDSLLERDLIRKVPDAATFSSTMAKNAKPVGEEEIARLNAAFVMAGVRDRSLVDEAAKMEVSLVRHSLQLRLLVLRYAQALLMLILTFIVCLLIRPITEFSLHMLEETGDFTYYTGSLFAIASLFIVWGILVKLVVKLPYNWIVASLKHHANELTDQQLHGFPRFVSRMSTFTWFASGFSILIGTGSILWHKVFVIVLVGWLVKSY